VNEFSQSVQILFVNFKGIERQVQTGAKRKNPPQFIVVSNSRLLRLVIFVAQIF
jgi:hypothetical protein